MCSDQVPPEASPDQPPTVSLNSPAGDNPPPIAPAGGPGSPWSTPPGAPTTSPAGAASTEPERARSTPDAGPPYPPPPAAYPPPPTAYPPLAFPGSAHGAPTYPAPADPGPTYPGPTYPGPTYPAAPSPWARPAGYGQPGYPVAEYRPIGYAPGSAPPPSGYPPLYPPGLFPPPPPPPAGPSRRGLLLAASLMLVLLLAAGAATIALVLGLERHPGTTDATSPTATSAPAAPTAASGLPQPISDPNANGPGPIDTAAVFAKVSPGVVNINTTLALVEARAAGTGMVLTSDGLVLTNNHVIAGATEMRVESVGNGRSYTGTVLGYSRSADVALVQLADAHGLRTVPIGDSDLVRIGQAIMAIGNAGGTGGKPTAVTGLVEAVNRTITATDELDGSTNRLTGLIQVQADIVAGDSGGPLVNRGGQVIGINTAASVSLQSQSAGGGRGFAIPIRTALAVAQQILNGTPSPTVHIGPTALLGVGTKASTSSGASVVSVLADGPAAKAGIVAGDVIVTFDGQTVSTPTDLGVIIDTHKPGDQVAIGWTDRSGQRRDATVTLATGPPA